MTHVIYQYEVRSLIPIFLHESTFFAKSQAILLLNWAQMCFLMGPTT